MSTIKDKISTRVNAALKQALNTDMLEQKIAKCVDQHIEKLIASALGFRSDGWGHWESAIGRETVLGAAITKLATATAEKMLANVLPAVEQQVPRNVLKEFERIAKLEYSSRLAQLCRDRAVAVGEQRATIDAQSIMNDLIAQECSEIQVQSQRGSDHLEIIDD